MLLIMGIFIALVVGLGLKLLAGTGIFDQWFAGGKRITWVEYLIGALLCSIVVVPFTVKIGNQWALSNNLKYHEFWSGYEVAALRSDTECHRDGSCQFTYDCDPYTVVVHHSATYDSKGNQTSAAYDSYETHYHSCPDATVEWDFKITTTLGDYHIERTFADNPVQFRSSHGLRGNVRIGAPPFWQAAADRIAAGNPGPVTVKKDYDNYILASQSTILHKFSSEMEQYKSVLPKPASTAPIRDYYYADKAYFVGTSPQAGWSDAVMKFNAGFGSELQGDLHVVIVGNGVTQDPDGFTGALNAYWTGPDLGRDDVSKNALIVVLGTDGSTVTWARAFTGMPRGNEALLFDIQRELKGKKLDPGIVLGSPVGKVVNSKFAGITHSQGALEQQVWGVNQFKRVSMTHDQSGGGGFTYLSADIQPTAGQKMAITTMSIFLSLLVWIAFILIGTNKETDDRSDPFGRRGESFGAEDLGYLSNLRSRIGRIGSFNRDNRW